jgi:hypothetical protein
MAGFLCDKYAWHVGTEPHNRNRLAVKTNQGDYRVWAQAFCFAG